jgi:beta-glucosidase/6-phospho-beta-glucosidase/beta-galactosidase
MPPFIFATGVENSYPTIRGADGRTRRIDQMEKTRHYQRWRDDFRLARELGVTHLRFGPPYYRVHRAAGDYDWEFSDAAFAALQREELHPIADLCHFGVPDWVGDFQNPDWPALFAEYAGAFAERYPWIRYYTPVNEIFITALFSAQYGWWNERLTGELSFVTALRHLCTANLLAMHAVRKREPNAVFVQTESIEHFHPVVPASFAAADFLNEKKFLALDLCCGRPPSSAMYEYLLDHGMTREEFAWFRKHRLRDGCLLGTDYYDTCEHAVGPDGHVSSAGETFGYYVLARGYWERYRLPLLHSETNQVEPGASAWLRKQWTTLLRLRQDGVPVLGFTWFGLTDMVDWDSALREEAGRVNTCGLYDLERRPRSVASAYRELIAAWQPLLDRDDPALLRSA